MAISILGPAATSAQQASTKGYVDTAVSDAVEPGVYQFEFPNNTAPLGVGTIQARRPFILTQQPTRFRVHFRNRNHLTDTDGTITLTNLTCYTGRAEIDASGNLTGNFAAAPTQVQGSGVSLVAGAEVITPWISPATFTITPYKWHLLSFGWTYTVNAAHAFGGGLQWYTFNAADASVAAPAGLTRADNQGFLSVYIEFEYQNDLAPKLLVVSNSLSGGGSTAAGNTNRGELDSWWGQWMLANGGIVANISAGGTLASHFNNASPKWNVYDTMANPLTIDVVVFMATSSSDVAASDGSGAAVNLIKGYMVEAIVKSQTKWPNARTLLTINPPRIGNATAAVESARQTVNTWLSTSPSGALECIDFEPDLTDYGQALMVTLDSTAALTLSAALPARLNAYSDSGDGEHWSARAHQRVSQLIPIKRQIIA